MFLTNGNNNQNNMNYFQKPIMTDNNTIREIKQNLISRNRDAILWVLDRMKTLMSDKDVILWFINANIPEDLCDAISFLDIVTSRCIYSCLEEMMQFQEFFAHNHASYALDSLIKGLFMLIKNDSNDIIVKEALSLLTVILHGYGKHGVFPAKIDIENTIQLLPEIFKDTIPAEMKIQIGFVVEKVLYFKILNLGDDYKEILFNVIIKWFSCSEQVAVHLSLDEFIILNCSLCQKILRFMICSKEWSEEDDMNNESNLTNEINSAIYKFLIEVGTPYFDEVLLHSRIDSKILEHFFQALVYAFEEMPKEKSLIAQKISCKGFLFHLANVLSFTDVSEEMNLRKLSWDLLTKILLTLSEDVFEFPEMWPGGFDSYRREIIRGVSQLPSDTSIWMDFLIDHSTHSSGKLALIIYLYFYFLCTKNFNAVGAVYPSIVNFVNFSTEIISQPLFVKAVWLVFAMSQWLKTQVPSPEETDLASELVIKLIDTQKCVDFIYTHHPAMLYWSISSNKIPPKLRHETLVCWIQNTNPDCPILDDFLKKNPAARLTLISILENGDGQIVESAFSILKSIVLSSKNDDVTRQIWFMIPSILKKYLTDPMKVTNADYMIELASLKTPDKPDMAKVSRTAGCLSEIIFRSTLISLIPCLRLAFQLVDCAEKKEDHRVAYIYLRANGFLQKIWDGINLKYPEMASFCLKIVTVLWKFPRESKDISISLRKNKDISKVKIKFKDLVHILAKGEITVVPSALELTLELLRSEFNSEFFDLKFPTLNELKDLYFVLQKAIVRELPDGKTLAWKCLKLCLNLKSRKTQKVIKTLIVDPWTHEIIRFSLQKPHDSPEMTSFLITWIELNSPMQVFCLPDRSIGDTYFAESVKLISAAIKEAKLSPDKSLCKKILQSNVNLSSETREEFDKIARS